MDAMVAWNRWYFVSFSLEHVCKGVKMKPKLLLDMDGVLVDFIGGAVKLHNLPSHPYDDPRMHGVWDFIPSTGMTEEEFWKPAGQKFWAELEPTTECFDIINLVEKHFDRDRICLLTSPCLNHGCIPGKMEWIEKHLPDYKRRFLAGPRKEFCAHDKAILMDDNDHNLNTFAACGGWTIPVPRLWNLHYENHENVLGWIENYLPAVLEAIQ